jgi:hypothetical protein
MKVNGRHANTCCQQVSNAFIVDLQDGDLNAPLGSSRHCFAEGGEYGSNCSWGDALAFSPSSANHRVCLAGTSLAIGDDSTIVAFDDSIQNRADCLVVDLLLQGLRGEDVVTPEKAVARGLC